jgi:hypothetical protein
LSPRSLVLLAPRPSRVHRHRTHFGLTTSIRPAAGHRDCGFRIADCGSRSEPPTFHTLFSVVSVASVVKHQSRWAQPTLPAHAAALSLPCIGVHLCSSAVASPLRPSAISAVEKEHCQFSHIRQRCVSRDYYAGCLRGRQGKRRQQASGSRQEGSRIRQQVCDYISWGGFAGQTRNLACQCLFRPREGSRAGTHDLQERRCQCPRASVLARLAKPFTPTQISRTLDLSDTRRPQSRHQTFI